MNSKQTTKSIEEQRKDLLRRARESQELGNNQAVKLCRAQLAALTTSKR